MVEPPDRSWMVDAACRGMGPSVFFLEAHDQVGAKRAYAVCDSCQVRVKCLNYVGMIDYDQARHGIWGGLSPKGRRNHPDVRAGMDVMRHQTYVEVLTRRG